jgi:hypothetical protein
MTNLMFSKENIQEFGAGAYISAGLPTGETRLCSVMQVWRFKTLFHT